MTFDNGATRVLGKRFDGKTKRSKDMVSKKCDHFVTTFTQNEEIRKCPAKLTF